MDALVFGVLTWSRFILLLSFSPTYIYSFTTCPKTASILPATITQRATSRNTPPPPPPFTHLCSVRQTKRICIACRSSFITTPFSLSCIVLASWSHLLIFFRIPLASIPPPWRRRATRIYRRHIYYFFFSPFSLLTAIPKGSPPHHSNVISSYIDE